MQNMMFIIYDDNIVNPFIDYGWTIEQSCYKLASSIWWMCALIYKWHKWKDVCTPF